MLNFWDKLYLTQYISYFHTGYTSMEYDSLKN